MRDKGLLYSLLTIAVVLVFTFTLADFVNEVGFAEAPWLHRTNDDVIYELRLEINALTLRMSAMAIDNRYLRKLVYTTKPDHWSTWLELLDHCKRLEEKMEELEEEITILEKKLNRELWQMPAPYWKA